MYYARSVCADVHVYARTRANARACVCVCVCIRACVCASVCVSRCVCVCLASVIFHRILCNWEPKIERVESVFTIY